MADSPPLQVQLASPHLPATVCFSETSHSCCSFYPGFTAIFSGQDGVECASSVVLRTVGKLVDVCFRPFDTDIWINQEMRSSGCIWCRKTVACVGRRRLNVERLGR